MFVQGHSNNDRSHKRCHKPNLNNNNINNNKYDEYEGHSCLLALGPFWCCGIKG